MTDLGLARVFNSMSQCPDLGALQRYWESDIGAEYKANPDVIAHKDRTKEALSK